MDVNFVYRISLHPIRAIYLLFWDKHIYVKRKNLEPATYAIGKVGTMRSFWAWGWGSNIYKKWRNIFQRSGSQMYTASCKASYYVLKSFT